MKTIATISGIDRVHAATVRKTVNVVIAPNFQSTYYLNVEAYVMESLATILPKAKCIIDKPKSIEKLRPPDSKFNIRAGIYLILGTEGTDLRISLTTASKKRILS